MSLSNFRKWFKYLEGLRGRQVEWPQFIRHVFEEEFNRLRKEDNPYRKDVFKDRDSDAFKHIQHPKQHLERVLVQRLFRETHEQSEGQLLLGGQPVWLVSYEVPNQGADRGCRADLLGVRLDGSLVVLECKPSGNKTSPFYALLEGLDYLGHICMPGNMKKLKDGFQRWRDKARNESVLSKIPKEFREVSINPDARHIVMVLAPEDYYSAHMKDAKGNSQDWYLLSDRMWSDSDRSVDLDFAITDFKPSDCHLWDLSREQMTPAQRRLVEDDIQVCTPEEADKLSQQICERKAQLKRESTNPPDKSTGQDEKPTPEKRG